jgi:hypothetical protein
VPTRWSWISCPRGSGTVPKGSVRAGYNALASQYMATCRTHGQDAQFLEKLVRRLSKAARVWDAGCSARVPVIQILYKHFVGIGADFAKAP